MCLRIYEERTGWGSPTSLVLPHQLEVTVQSGLQSQSLSFFPPFLLHHGPESIHGSYFANPHPPAPAILKTTSDPCSDSSANYIPHPTRHAINWYQHPTRTPRKIRHINGTSGNHTTWCLAWCFRLMCKKSTIQCGRFELTPPLLKIRSGTGEVSLAIAKPGSDPRCAGVQPAPCRDQYMIFHPFHPNGVDHPSDTWTRAGLWARRVWTCCGSAIWYWV